jgi:hypothetical protein
MKRKQVRGKWATVYRLPLQNCRFCGFKLLILAKGGGNAPLNTPQFTRLSLFISQKTGLFGPSAPNRLE